MSATLEKIRSEFRHFPEDFSLAPLWYWNDRLDDRELARQLREMKRKHVTQAMIFCMAGMQQEYLSEAYFERFRFTLNEARKLGMKIWVYDDYCWPSGLAGGIINEKYPEHLMTHCRFYRYPVSRRDPRELHRRLPQGQVIQAVAVRRSDGKQVSVMDSVGGTDLRWRAPRGDWDVTLCVVTGIQHVLDTVTAARWSNNLPGYLDVMNREAVAKYIELVYEGHYHAAPEHYGKTMLGYFTDEPGIGYDADIRGGRTWIKLHTQRTGVDNAYRQNLAYEDEPNLYGLRRSLPWTRGLLDIFKDRVGYDLRPELHRLADEDPAHRKLAFHFFNLVSDLFAENYCDQIGAWCGKHRVAYSGHYGEGIHGGDHYKQVRPQQVPGIDLLGGRGAVVNLLPLPRKVASMARLHGRQRVLCETYGASQWNVEMSGKIQAADLLTVMGINLHVPIDYAYSFRSFRKHTSNPPGFFQASNWPYQRRFSDRTARFSYMVTQGESTVCTAILHPTEAALSNTLVDAAANADIDSAVKTTLFELLRSQVEADILSDTALSACKIRRGTLAGAGVVYRNVVLPSMTLIGEQTLQRLTRFVRGGGTLVVRHKVPLHAPEGKSLRRAWKDELGVTVRNEDVRRSQEVSCGRGRLVFVPDPVRMIRLSAVPRTGEKISMFDGTDSLMCLDASYPHWVSIDFGASLDLVSVKLAREELKKSLLYVYDIQVSDDGRSWQTVATVSETGQVQTVPLHNVKSRHLRLYVKQAGKRFFGVHDLEILYRDRKGNTRRWVPSEHDPRQFAAVLPDALGPLVFYKDGQLASSLVVSIRKIGAARTVAAANMSGTEHSFEAENRTGKTVEFWDLDTGKTSRVSGSGRNRRFRVSFAPWEAKVFVLSGRAKKGVRNVCLDRRRETVRDLQPPWRFHLERENALPLSLDLRMADPAAPRAWLWSEQGRIPEPFRFVPSLLFESRLTMNAVTGHECLLFEEGVVSALNVNGRPVEAASKRHRYLDTFGRSVPIGRLLHKGRNVIRGRYAPEIYERDTHGSCYAYPKLQPTLDAFVLGPFSVIKGKIVKQRTHLDAEPWQDQGFPFYSGTATYTVDLPSNLTGPLWLECGVREGVMEVRVDGKHVGTRLAPPYLVDLGKLLVKGRHRLKVRVTNAVGSLLAAQGIGSLAGPAEYESGLKFVRLVRPLR